MTVSTSYSRMVRIKSLNIAHSPRLAGLSESEVGPKRVQLQGLLDRAAAEAFEGRRARQGQGGS